MSPFQKKIILQAIKLTVAVALGTAALYFMNVAGFLGILITLLFVPLFGLVHLGLFTAATVAPVASVISFIGIGVLTNPLIVCAALSLLVVPSFVSLCLYGLTGEKNLVPSLWSFIKTWASGAHRAPEVPEPIPVAGLPTPADTPVATPRQVEGLRGPFVFSVMAPSCDAAPAQVVDSREVSYSQDNHTEPTPQPAGALPPCPNTPRHNTPKSPSPLSRALVI